MIKINRRSFNNIGTIINIFLVFITIIIISLNLYINNSVISRHLALMEEAQVTNQAEKVKNILKVKAQEVELIARDYAVWDDAYNKIRERDLDWFHENLTDWLPGNYDIELIAVIDNQNRLVVGNGLMENDINPLLQKEEIKSALRGDQFTEGISLNGIVTYYDNVYLVGFCPVFRTDYSGPSEGTLILGKKITKELIKSIELQYDYQVSIDFNGSLVSAMENHEAEEFYQSIRTKDQGVIRLDDNRIVVRIPFSDISGETIGNINLLQSRELFVSTLDLISKNAINVFLISISLIIITGLIFRRFIVIPITNLENQIQNMEQKNTMSYVDIQGPNEIRSLATRFNDMTDTVLEIHKQEKIYLEELSRKDFLTSLYNHKSFYEDFNNQIAVNKLVAVLFCDLDRFKQVNDHYGHTIGDQVLKESAALIKEKINNLGKVYRYGGEEFAILLPEKNVTEALTIAEEIREEFLDCQELQQYAAQFPISISIGIASYPEDGQEMETIITKADKAMFYSKANGRDQCNRYQEEMKDILNKNNTK